jgi:HEAT repeat protein
MRTPKNTVRMLIVYVGVGAAGQPILAATNERAGEASSPAPFEMKKAQVEIEQKYAKAHPEIQEYIAWTARSFGAGGMWLNDDAFAALSKDERDKKVQHLAALLEDGEYGRHLCAGLAEAGAIKDKRLVPGLMKVAGYHVDDRDYDCRPKWMAVAALARQESDEAVPLLVSLVDHGNQNTRMWARAALSRQTGQDFKQDKRAWANWWKAQGHDAIDGAMLKPSKAARPASP